MSKIDINDLKANILISLGKADTALQPADIENIDKSVIENDDDIVTKTLLTLRGLGRTTPSDNDSLSIDFEMENDIDAATIIGRIRYLMTDVTDGTEDSTFLMQGLYSGSLIDLLQVRGHGEYKFGAGSSTSIISSNTTSNNYFTFTYGDYRDANVNGYFRWTPNNWSAGEHDMWLSNEYFSVQNNYAEDVFKVDKVANEISTLYPLDTTITDNVTNAQIQRLTHYRTSPASGDSIYTSYYLRDVSSTMTELVRLQAGYYNMGGEAYGNFKITTWNNDGFQTLFSVGPDGTNTGVTVSTIFTYKTARSLFSDRGNVVSTTYLNVANGAKQKYTLTTNVTINDSNITSSGMNGQHVEYWFYYSGAQRTITWPSTWFWLNGEPTAPSSASEILIVSLSFDGVSIVAGWGLATT